MGTRPVHADGECLNLLLLCLAGGLEEVAGFLARFFILSEIGAHYVAPVT